MKVAAIDIGTNSIRLLIAESLDLSFRTLERKMNITRIGKNLEITGKISKDSTTATSEVLKKYKELMEKNDVDAYRAVGTNAVRKASNSKWFISYIGEETGIEVEVITGEEEAYLNFLGASDDLETDSKMLVLDIGGGSTEFILGNKELDFELNESIDIGSVNLSERFIKGGKPGGKELKNMHLFIRDSIIPIFEKIKGNRDFILIGIAGTITTVAAIDLKLEEHESIKIHHHLMNYKKVLEIYIMLCGLSLKERRRVKGLQPERADIIIGGTAVLLEVMKFYRKGNIMISEHDILDGIIYSIGKF